MIGQLKDRVQVKTPEKISNGRGGWTVRENDLGFKWAAVMPVSFRELAQYAQLEKNINARFIMRRDPAITVNSLIFHNGKRYKVESVLDRLSFNGYIEILAQGEAIQDG